MAAKKTTKSESKTDSKKGAEASESSSGEASRELHHAPVEKATPEHAFDDKTLDVAYEGALAIVAKTPSDKHEALVAAWVARRNAGAIAAVAQKDDAPSTARKAARRAVGVLKSRGIAVPERSTVAALVQKPSFTMEARVLFPDGRGAQLWWIAKISSTGGTDVVEITTADRGGIVNLQRGNPSAGNLRQLLQSWVGRTGRAPTEVPLEFARHRIALARRFSEQHKQVLPMGIDAAKELLEPAPKEAKHPIDAEELALPTDEAAVKARLEKSMHLHEEPEFGSWLPEDPAAVAFLENINERVTKLETKEQEKIDATVREAIDEAADAYFSEDRKALYVARLRDAAWSLYRAGLVDRTIDALLVANAIAKAGVISDRPSEIAFVRGMFLKLLAVAQQRAGAMAPKGNEEAARLE